MMPPRKILPEENVDSWLMSYADLITLLMCFFIIFVSVSEPRKERISMLSSGMGGKFGTVDLVTPFDGVIRTLQGVVENNKSFNDITIENNDKEIAMEMSSTTFFKPFTAELAPEKLPLLNEIIASLRSIDFIDYRISIEGHTSDSEPQSGLYATNWELSSARAARIVRVFIENGIRPKDIKAVGFAGAYPKVPNLDMNGNAIAANREKNERVLVKLERLK
ncbi:MAG: OmpA family protein [Rickettsiales bacterium]